MRRLAITCYELPRFNVRDITDSPNIFCAFNAEEFIDHDGAVGIEIGGGDVGRVGD